MKMLLRIIVYYVLVASIVGAQHFCCDKLQKLEERLQVLESSGRNLKQYEWNNLSVHKDIGEIVSVKFLKKKINSSLKLTWSGNLRVMTPPTTGAGCSRWFFKINNKECKSPAAIDGTIFQDIALNMHQQTTIVGICKVPLAGELTISFNVGVCPGSSGPSDADTCWNSVCRIIAEEV